MSSGNLPKRRYVALIGLLALAFFVLGVFSFIETLAITRSRSVTTARVIESRVFYSSRNGTSHDLRYLFSPEPGQPEIGRSDFLGRSWLWSSLPEDEWKAAIANRSLQVRFDPANPGNNSPEASLPSLGSCIVPFILGSVILIPVIAAERLRIRQQQLPNSESPH